MSTTKKPTKSPEELQAALQKLIAQGRKEGMIRAADLAVHLEAMDLSPERIEEIYDQFEAMNIQIVSAELDLDLDDAIVDGDIDLADVEEEDLVDPVDLAAEYILTGSSRLYSAARSTGSTRSSSSTSARSMSPSAMASSRSRSSSALTI